MDIILNDGTFARNVSVWEYEQLKAKGLVGKTNTRQEANVPTATEEPIPELSEPDYFDKLRKLYPGMTTTGDVLWWAK